MTATSASRHGPHGKGVGDGRYRRPRTPEKAPRFLRAAAARCRGASVRPVSGALARSAVQPASTRNPARGFSRGGTHDDHHHPADHQQHRSTDCGSGAIDRRAAPEGVMRADQRALGIGIGKRLHR